MIDIIGTSEVVEVKATLDRHAQSVEEFDLMDVSGELSTKDDNRFDSDQKCITLTLNCSSNNNKHFHWRSVTATTQSCIARSGKSKWFAHRA
jgi:hypothetical protein